MKVDAKTAFLQNCSAQRAVYVIPPYESDDKRQFVWLLMTAAYGFVNANATWQAQSDDLLLNSGLQLVALIPQLFARFNSDYLLVALVAKLLMTSLYVAHELKSTTMFVPSVLISTLTRSQEGQVF